MNAEVEFVPVSSNRSIDSTLVEPVRALPPVNVRSAASNTITFEEIVTRDPPLPRFGAFANVGLFPVRSLQKSSFVWSGVSVPSSTKNIPSVPSLRSICVPTPPNVFRNLSYKKLAILVLLHQPNVQQSLRHLVARLVLRLARHIQRLAVRSRVEPMLEDQRLRTFHGPDRHHRRLLDLVRQFPPRQQTRLSRS